MGFTFANLPKLARSCSSVEQTSSVMGFINGFGVLAGIGLALAITVPIIYSFTNSYHDVFYIWAIPLIITTILWWIVVDEPPCTTNQNQVADPWDSPRLGVGPNPVASSLHTFTPQYILLHMVRLDSHLPTRKGNQHEHKWFINFNHVMGGHSNCHTGARFILPN